MKPFPFQAIAVAASVLALVAAAPVAAQPKSSPPIELIVPWGPSGGADQVGRRAGKMLEGVLNTQIAVVNVPGSTGNKGLKKLLKANADGQSVAVLNADTYALLAHANPGWRAEDVVPLAILTLQHSALFVPENSRFKNWSDLEKEARLKPGSLKVAITGLASTDYIALEQLASKGVKLVPVPFADPAQRYRSVATGEADVLYEQPGDVRERVEKRELRPILAFGNERLAFFKNIPTAKELGYAVVPQFRALVVRAGTDPERVKALSAALDKVAAMPEFKALLQEQWAADSSYVSGSGAVEVMKRELAAMKAIVDRLPLHARHLVEEMEVAQYIEPF